MSDFKGRTALIVEDQYLIALDLEDHLLALGFDKAMIAGNAAEAERLTGKEAFAAAFLDVGLAVDGESAELAQLFREQAVPFVLVTGFSDRYGEAHVFHGAPVVRKPYDREHLRRAISLILPGDDAA